jgi:hypothetical protein
MVQRVDEMSRHPGRAIIVDSVVYESETRVIYRRPISDLAFVRTCWAPFSRESPVSTFSCPIGCELVAYVDVGPQSFPTRVRRIFYLRNETPDYIDGLTLPAPCNNAVDPTSIVVGGPCRLPGEVEVSAETIERETERASRTRDYWQQYRAMYNLPFAVTENETIAKPRWLINHHATE